MKNDNNNETGLNEVNEWEEYEEFDSDIVSNEYSEETLDSEESYDFEELTDDEAEDTTGGATMVGLKGTSINPDAQKKGYSKHCGGIRISTSSPTITVTQLGARLGKIDKTYITQSSIPVKCLIGGPASGPDSIQVIRKTGRLGLVTIEAWGHQKGEPKNYRYGVLRVQFN